jgi:branched-chain amino acid transport system substrate-binding protein
LATPGNRGVTVLRRADGGQVEFTVLSVWDSLEAVKSFAGDVTMRASDHQLQQSMYVTKWQKVDKKYPYSVENTGYTFVPIKQMDPYVASTPTSTK